MPDTENEGVSTEAQAVSPLGEVINPTDATSTEGTAPTTPTSQSSDPTPPPASLSNEDPFAAAIEAARRAEREVVTADIEARVRAELESRAQAERETARAEAEAERARNAFADTVREVHSNLRGITFRDDEGKEYKLTDSQIEDLAIKPVQKYNSNAQNALQMQVLTQLAQAAISTLPADQRAEFEAKAASKPLTDWLRIYAETFAPNTKTVLDMKREEEVKVKAAEARGAARGQKMPVGTPSNIADQSTQLGNFDLSSAEGVASAQAAGYFKTDTEFLKAWRTATTGRSY